MSEWRVEGVAYLFILGCISYPLLYNKLLLTFSSLKPQTCIISVSTGQESMIGLARLQNKKSAGAVDMQKLTRLGDPLLR